jgi:hypothetical protein
MTKFYATLQLLGAAILGLVTVATAINMILIANRPETISVVNAMVGQSLLIICLIVLMRSLVIRGLRGLRQAGHSKRSMGKPRESGQTSTIRTEFLAMELEHNTGNMDGAVLKGYLQGKQLSSLSIHQLLELYTQCQGDADSAQVLIAYLDRNHTDWRDVPGEQTRRSSAAPQLDDSQLTRPLALEILGLTDPVDAKKIADAHRQLMQKLHPDRGGSDYLAKKINSARGFLLDS